MPHPHHIASYSYLCSQIGTNYICLTRPSPDARKRDHVNAVKITNGANHHTYGGHWI